METLPSFKQHWKSNFEPLLRPNIPVLVAVSGGLDSTVLTDLLYASNIQFCIVHCNFRLRGEESERDCAFVKDLAVKYDKQLFIKEFDTVGYAEDHKLSIQEAARNLRYGWFDELLEEGDIIDIDETGKEIKKSRYSHLLTAHHGDDNIETTLFHFIRGTGLQGLCGISPIHKEKRIMRPLLKFRRKELAAYAEKKGLGYVEDSSNKSEKYTRNLLRLNILPHITEHFPHVEENILHNIERFQEAQILYDQAIQQHIKRLLETKGEEIHIPILKLKKTTPLRTVVWEIIKQFGFAPQQVDEAIKLLDSANGSYMSSQTNRIFHNRGWLIIAPPDNEYVEHHFITEFGQSITVKEGKFSIETVNPSELPQSITTTTPENKQDTQSPFLAYFDADAITFPLIFRKYKSGDYFYPLGMVKKKKLSRFLIDIKLSRTEKEKVWVLESDKRIVWVVGHRIDNRVKILPKTKNMAKATFVANQ